MLMGGGEFYVALFSDETFHFSFGNETTSVFFLLLSYLTYFILHCEETSTKLKKKIVGHSHPLIFQLIKVFRQEFLVDEIKIQRAALGQITSKKKKKHLCKKTKNSKKLMRKL